MPTDGHANLSHSRSRHPHHRPTQPQTRSHTHTAPPQPSLDQPEQHTLTLPHNSHTQLQKHHHPHRNDNSPHSKHKTKKNASLVSQSASCTSFVLCRSLLLCRSPASRCSPATPPVRLDLAPPTPLVPLARRLVTTNAATAPPGPRHSNRTASKATPSVTPATPHRTRTPTPSDAPTVQRDVHPLGSLHPPAGRPASWPTLHPPAGPRPSSPATSSPGGPLAAPPRPASCPPPWPVLSARSPQPLAASCASHPDQPRFPPPPRLASSTPPPTPIHRFLGSL
ncbi:hypothetical protein I4F81_003942 [Pyropia yezoensis]|uniref:Uncharacterized protein n=1 Tax=Pyropia yezoensis TaxID=2788 RepID=A0ACC3BUT2_PYRYE|nr:hypothetical protein I4F81_003942 [Neopyropia yezoensis]